MPMTADRVNADQLTGIPARGAEGLAQPSGAARGQARRTRGVRDAAGRARDPQCRQDRRPTPPGQVLLKLAIGGFGVTLPSPG